MAKAKAREPWRELAEKSDALFEKMAVELRAAVEDDHPRSEALAEYVESERVAKGAHEAHEREKA